MVHCKINRFIAKMMISVLYTDRKERIFTDWENHPEYELPADTKDVKTLVRVIARMSDYYVVIILQ